MHGDLRRAYEMTVLEAYHASGPYRLLYQATLRAAQVITLDG